MAVNVKVGRKISFFLHTASVNRKESDVLGKRVYQGSSGWSIPILMIEKIEDTCEDKSYHAVYLENEYIKVMILPELGGGYRWRTIRSSSVISSTTTM